MGIIAAALVANGDLADIKSMPDWIPLACYAAIGLGTLSGGWKNHQDHGNKDHQGDTAGRCLCRNCWGYYLVPDWANGYPGFNHTYNHRGDHWGRGYQRLSAVAGWGVTVNLLWAWILTIPISALLAGGILDYEFLCSLNPLVSYHGYMRDIIFQVRFWNCFKA